MNTTIEQTEKAYIGMELYFNKGDYEYTMRISGKVIAAIDAVIDSYRQLGLPTEITGDTLEELVSSGISKTRSALEGMIKQDTDGMKSVLLKNEAFQKVDLYLKPLDEAVSRLKESIIQANQENTDLVYGNRYYLTIKDFTVINGRASVIEQRVRKHFTQVVENENQVLLYDRLQELKILYNEIVKFVKETGNKMPPGGVLGTGRDYAFLMRPFKDGFPVSDEVEMIVRILKHIK